MGFQEPRPPHNRFHRCCTSIETLVSSLRSLHRELVSAGSLRQRKRERTQVLFPALSSSSSLNGRKGEKNKRECNSLLSLSLFLSTFQSFCPFSFFDSSRQPLAPLIPTRIIESSPGAVPSNGSFLAVAPAHSFDHLSFPIKIVTWTAKHRRKRETTTQINYHNKHRIINKQICCHSCPKLFQLLTNSLKTIQGKMELHATNRNCYSRYF